MIEKEAEAPVSTSALTENSELNFIIPDSDDEFLDSKETESEFMFFADSSDSNAFGALADSTIIDSTLLDSTYLESLADDSLSIDSTARLQNFKFSRNEDLTVSVGEKKKSLFFSYPSSAYYRRTVELDSTGQYVYIKETLNNKQEKIYLKLPLDEFISLRLDALNRGLWENQAYAYEVKKDEGDLGKLLADITNIEIPLPSTGVLSIFGDPKISLRINGSVDIHGAWRTETTEGLTASRLGNTRNEPDFSQQVQISVVGKIGDKLSINADWNTERTFEYENQLKLIYTGYDDEIVQSVEAGNVSLQTSPLVGGGEALFGVKSTFKMGPFTLTALASQKKGEIKEVNVSGGSEKQKFEVHAYEYSNNNYFLDVIYASREQNLNFFERYYGNPIFQPTPETSFWEVIDVEVWKSTTGLVDQGRERKVNAFIDLDPIPKGQEYNDAVRDTLINPINGESVINSRFIKLTEGVDYIIQPYVGYLQFKTQIQKDDNLAVAFRIQGETSSPDDDLVYGQFTKDLQDSSVVVLKLIKPKNLQPQYKDAWKLQLKNIYPIGGRDIKKDGFTLDVTYRTEGQEPRNDWNGQQFLQLFGLDKTDESGSSTNSDGAFDFNERTIFTQTGEIIFPSLEPFGNDLPKGLPDSLKFNAVYDTTTTFAKQDRTKDKFLLVGEYSASVTSTYSIGFSVVENSVRVSLGGNTLQEGVDYVVDYNIGQLSIRNDAALVPGADLKITYEQNDLFQLASKTLLGMRGLFEFNKDTKLGFSFLNLDQQTLSDKVRIGEEPLSNSIYGVDFETKVELPILTNVLDYFISTRANSSLNLKGEFAYMNPDPNTKKSPIASDNNESIAYIDDYEGAKKIIPIGLSYTSWKDISLPVNINDYVDGLSTPLEKMRYKSRAWWYQIIPSTVTTAQIWPDRKVARDNEQVTVLDFMYDPSIRGMNNSDPDIGLDSKQNWGGMMKGLSSSASNLIEENIEFIEFWVQMADENDNITHFPDVKLIIDLGQISEDIIPNGILNTEDKNSNDIVDEGEDTGIDGKKNSDEPGYDPVTNPDPNADDFSLTQNSPNPIDYLQLTGTEGNAQLSDIGRFPDSEDLNRNFSLDRANSYFRYEIPLDTNRLTNEFVTGGGLTEQKWYQFKIPLKDFVDDEGTPSFSVIENIRLWFTGIDQRVRLRITEFNLVGNQWQKVLNPPIVDESDTVLTISTINVEENGDVYSSPPGVGRERDRTRPDQEVFKNEQSLQLILKKLEDGHKREIVKYLFKPLDVFDYTEMKLFIHGDEDYDIPGTVSNYVSDSSYATEVYFRFGSDSTNFYEYRQPVRYNAANMGWDEIGIKFETLTAIKEKRNQDSTNIYYKTPVPDKPGHFYGIRGNPTLTRITFFTIGILNPSDKGTPLEKVSGDIWVNELRVLGADDTPGWAYSVSSAFKLADLLSVNFNAKQTDPYFHKLSDRFGNRVDQRSWGVSASLDVIKLLPLNLEGSALSVQYSHNESLSQPLYRPGTDVLVSEAAKASNNPDSLITEAETFSIKDSWSLSSIKLRIPTDFWLIRDTFNSLTFGFNFNNSYSRSPTVYENTSWIWNAKGDYALNLGKNHFIYPANLPVIGMILQLFSDYRNLKIYFLPQSVKVGVSAKRNENYSLSRSANAEAQIQRDFTSSRDFDFKWTISEGGIFNPDISYNLNILSSLAYLLTDEEGSAREEGEIWNDIFNGAMFGKDYDYKQNFDFKLSPALPSLFDLNKYFKLNAGYSVSYNWKWNFQQEDLGRSAGWSNRINAGLNLRLQSLMDPLFGQDTPETKAKAAAPARGRNTNTTRGNRGRNVDQAIEDQNNKNEARNNDSTVVIPDSLEYSGPGLFYTMFNIIKNTTQYLLFDYEQISFNFSQTNQYSAGGLASEGTGFWNFWGAEQNEVNGPGRLFMLGLSNDAGPRAVGGTLSDRSSQSNKFDFKTSRPLWEGAKLDIDWTTGWGNNRATTFRTDSLTGAIEVTNLTSSGNIDRSFLHLPIPPFNSGLNKVNELYDPNAENVNESLSNAFVEGLETFPWIAQLPGMEDIAKLIPRPNWKISWTGLEKISFLEGLAQRITLNHAYTSSYSEGWKMTPEGLEEIQIQKVSYGFAPLIGVNLTFKELLGGNVTGSVKFSSKTNYDLGLSTRNVTESLSKDINISASYSKSGFDIPLFGLSLKNDIEISFSYTLGQNSVVLYKLGENYSETGEPQDGTTRTTIEPRIRYVMSSRVTLSVFFKSTTVEPQGASRIPPTSTNEAGLDVHIAIQ